jgi:ubiquinone/menaquinone biosynthesis C-methylase UbiE
MVDVQRDPEEVETRYLHRFAEPTGDHVVEIGCGDGRLTWRYATVTSHVCGVDTDASSLGNALRTRPKPLANHAHFVVAKAEAFPFADQTFSLAVLAWSL